MHNFVFDTNIWISIFWGKKRREFLFRISMNSLEDYLESVSLEDFSIYQTIDLVFR